MKWTQAESGFRSAAVRGRPCDSFPLTDSPAGRPALRFQGAPQALARPGLASVVGVGCQAIFLFLVALSLAAAEQDRGAGTAESTAAARPQLPLTLRIASDGRLFLGAEAIEAARLPAALARQKPANGLGATLIVCADRGAAAGVVRRAIKICQDAGVDNFLLRDAATGP
jgi:biopolymer transport protein ExbD